MNEEKELTDFGGNDSEHVEGKHWMWDGLWFVGLICLTLVVSIFVIVFILNYVDLRIEEPKAMVYVEGIGCVESINTIEEVIQQNKLRATLGELPTLICVE